MNLKKCWGNLLVTLLISSVSFDICYSNVPKFEELILTKFKDKNLSSNSISSIKDLISKNPKMGVKKLIEVMKSSEYPDKSRWLATILLGKTMGKKSSNFIAKFANHPDWILRAASLKTLLSLQVKDRPEVYVQALKDSSLIVRDHALDSIRHLKMKDRASYVYKMLFDERNYFKTKKGLKRSRLVGKAIKVLGELNYTKAIPLFSKMLKKKKYEDIFQDLNYAMSLLNKRKKQI